MSKISDAAGAEEDIPKGKVPKGMVFLRWIPWAWREECHDCHHSMERYQLCDYQVIQRSNAQALLLFLSN